MRTLLKIGFGLLVLAVVMIALLFSMLRAKGTTTYNINERHVLSSETRTVSAEVTEIDLSGPIDLTLRQGAIASMKVSGEKRFLENVGTTQSGNSLSIGPRGMLLHHKHPLQVTLTLPSLDKLELRGSGDSEVNGFSGDKVEVQLSGSGSLKFNGRYKDVVAGVSGSGDMEMNGGDRSDKVDVTLAGSGRLTVVGQCKKFKAELVGSGDLEAEHLAAPVADVTLSGSGTLVVQAQRSVLVNLKGSGDVTVLGNPSERVINKTGAGEVNFRDD